MPQHHIFFFFLWAHTHRSLGRTPGPEGDLMVRQTLCCYVALATFMFTNVLQLPNFIYLKQNSSSPQPQHHSVARFLKSMPLCPATFSAPMSFCCFPLVFFDGGAQTFTHHVGDSLLDAYSLDRKSIWIWIDCRHNTAYSIIKIKKVS